MKKTAERKFFQLLADHFGGTTGIANKLGVDFWLASNWKTRGYIPAEYVIQASKVFGISPLVLNNKHFHYISDWKAQLAGVEWLTEKELSALLKLPLEFKNEKAFVTGNGSPIRVSKDLSGSSPK